MPRYRIFALLVALAAILALLGGAALPTASAQPPLMLNIGVIDSPQSPTARGIFLAIQEATAKGGLILPDGRPFALQPITGTRAPLTRDEVREALSGLRNAGAVAIFGPDDPIVADQNSAALAAAGVPIFTSAPNRETPRGDLIFRTSATDEYRAGALVEYLVGREKLSRVGLFTTIDAPFSAYESFRTAFLARNIEVLGGQPANDSAIDSAADAFFLQAPQAIYATGTARQIARFYTALRGRGYAGIFATNVINDPEFFDTLTPSLRINLYGTAGWTYENKSELSRKFTENYSRTYGVMPNERAAAAYDATTLLIEALKEGGTSPVSLTAALRELAPRNGVQGRLVPTDSTLSKTANVIATGQFGAPLLLAAYEPRDMATLIAALSPTSTPRGQQPSRTPTQGPATATPRVSPTATATATLPPNVTPSATFTPSQTFTPSATFTASATFTPSATNTPIPPTATPDGVTLTIIGRLVNVRTGPGRAYDVIGQLNNGEQVKLTGANSDLTWFTFVFREQQAWITGDTSLISLFGDPRTLPVVQPPPLPTATALPSSTSTVTPEPRADITFISATLNPPIPQPGQPFQLSVTVQNIGTVNAGEFAIATSFKPGDVYAAQVVAGLPVGQQITVLLSATVNGTGSENIAIVIDLNKQIDEGAAGEANNEIPFSYKIDRPYVAQGTVQLAPSTSLDLFGGTQDITYTGTDLVPINGAQFGIIAGVQFSQLHYDFLSPALVNSTNGIPLANLPAGALVGIYTSEGARGILRVNSVNGSNLVLDYFIYQP